MVKKLELTQVTYTGNTVSENMFGGNALHTRNTNDGVLVDQYAVAIDSLGIRSLRYPAGQVNQTYADGLLIKGRLPQHLVNFMEQAKANNTKVVIVTPTIIEKFDSDELAKFAKLLMVEFGDHIEAFEIGNEYWSHINESQYGNIADKSVMAIDKALSALDMDADIWIQMSNASGEFSNFKNDNQGWIDRTISSNIAIISEISQEARSIVSGVVEHYYYKRNDQYLSEANDPTNFIDLDFDIWKSYLGWDISLNITEWNIKSSNLYQLGMRAASTLIAQFGYMMEMEVDTSYVWPPQHNTTNDLAGTGQVIIDSETGVVLNSIGGAIYSMMSKQLVGLEHVMTSVTDSGSSIVNHFYADDDRAVVYIASRSEAEEQVIFSLGELFPAARLTSATLLGYDKNSSNGKHYSSAAQGYVNSDYVMINGEKYYLNEHDVRAEVSQLSILDAEPRSEFEFSLQPYQVIQLTYSLTSAKDIYGTSGSDTIVGTSLNEVIYGKSGADTLSGEGGDDRLFGSDGDDDLNGGAGNDILIGGRGNDKLEGGLGNDLLHVEHDDILIDGGPGFDIADFSSSQIGLEIYSSHLFADTAVGRIQNMEEIHGTEFSDAISFISGVVEVHGGGGDDKIWKLGDPGSSVYGGDGDDLIKLSDDTIGYGGRGNDTIFSSEGDEVIYAGSGDDFIILRTGNDEVTTGAGRDTIWINSWSDPTRVLIHDFEIGKDSLFLFGIHDLQDGLSFREYAHQEGPNLLIDNEIHWVIELKDIELGDFFL